ncbi:MAG: hypothetical protein H6828_15630 [Planctomycetes bacterium]|nr:hypothetical protein [Planctomycetota bacterium]
MRPLLLPLLLALAAFAGGWSLGRTTAPRVAPAQLEARGPKRSAPQRTRCRARSPRRPPTRTALALRPTAAAPLARQPVELPSPAEAAPGSLALPLDAVELYVQAHLAAGRPLEALALLRAAREVPSGCLVETATALAQAGFAPEARELYERALRYDPTDFDTLEAFVALDPRACLDTFDLVERELVAFGYEPSEFARGRARALTAAGRAAEAVEFLPALDSYFVPSSGCVVAHSSAQPWELEAWAAVDPQGVRALLERVLAENHTGNDTALIELAKLAGRTSQDVGFAQARERFVEQHGDDLDVEVALAPYAGWERVRAALDESAADTDAVEALVAHDLESGERGRAAELFARYTEQNDDPQAWGPIVETAPELFRPQLDRYLATLRARAAAGEDVSWQLGDFASLEWDLGAEDLARALWREADASDPDGGTMWAEERRSRELRVRW